MKVLLCLALLAAPALADTSVNGTVIQLWKQDVGTISQVRIGKDKVDPKATCAFVDKTGAVVSTDCVIVKIDERITVVKSRSMQMDDVKQNPVVRFTNP